MVGSIYSSLSLFLALSHQLVSGMTLEPRAITKDAPFTVKQPDIEAVVTCPKNVGQAKGGIVLLVHGTGENGVETFGSTPYMQILPRFDFDVCYVTLPGRSQTDIQVTSEYVAGNIVQLADKSKTKKISIIGHSQGNLNIQWALNFWPSKQKYVERFISLAGDFHGTDEALGACLATGVLGLQGKCTEAFLQQMTTRFINGKSSNFITALNTFGNKALVPTTSIYTLQDDIIQSEVGPKATSIVPGAENIMLQNSKICGVAHFVEHLTILVDPAAFNLAYGALTNTPGATVSTWNRNNCNKYIGSNFLSTAQVKAMNALPGTLASAFGAIGSTLGGLNAATEPKLMSYVCESGSAPDQQCR